MNLEKKSLKRTFADIQHGWNYPGLVKECEKILIQFGSGDKSPKHFSKLSWMNLIRRKIRDENQKYILEESERYTNYVRSK